MNIISFIKNGQLSVHGFNTAIKYGVTPVIEDPIWVFKKVSEARSFKIETKKALQAKLDQLIEDAYCKKYILELEDIYTELMFNIDQLYSSKDINKLIKDIDIRYPELR